jgi:hypothetical protein
VFLCVQIKTVRVVFIHVNHSSLAGQTTTSYLRYSTISAVSTRPKKADLSRELLWLRIPQGTGLVYNSVPLHEIASTATITKYE